MPLGGGEITKFKPPKVLVLTLYCGEGEYEICKSSVQKQAGVIVEHKVFEWLGNREGHEALYREIMNRSHQFDYFLKLDADMVFASNWSLIDLCKKMLSDPDVDHLSLPVYDIPSESYLLGFHLFTARVVWQFPLDSLFPDRHPVIPGKRLIDRSAPVRYVNHMPAPTEDQAFALGLHRATKIVQALPGGPRKSAEFPLSYLKRVAVSRKFNKKLKQQVMLGMFRGLISSAPAITNKNSHRKPARFTICEFTLAYLFQVNGARRIIFLFLQFRYVYCRRHRLRRHLSDDS